MSSSARHIPIIVNQGMPGGNHMVIRGPPRCQVTPMGGYKTIQSSRKEQIDNSSVSSIEVLVLLAICYSTVVSGTSNDYSYFITCVSVINSDNTS